MTIGNTTAMVTHLPLRNNIPSYRLHPAGARSFITSIAGKHLSLPRTNETVHRCAPPERIRAHPAGALQSNRGCYAARTPAPCGRLHINNAAGIRQQRENAGKLIRLPQTHETVHRCALTKRIRAHPSGALRATHGAHASRGPQTQHPLASLGNPTNSNFSCRGNANAHYKQRADNLCRAHPSQSSTKCHSFECQSLRFR